MDKVWAYCNFSSAKECDRSLSLLYKLQEVIKDSRFTLEVVLLGEKHYDNDFLIEHLKGLNVSKVYCIADNTLNGINNYSSYVEAMQILVNKYNPKYLMFSGSRHNRIVAAQLATALESGLTAECTRYYVDMNGEIIQIRPTFEGNTYAHIMSGSAVKMSTALPSLYQHILMPDSTESVPEFEVIELLLRTSNKAVYINNSSAADTAGTSKRNHYDVMFVAGMGLGSEENVNKLKKLAKRHNAGFGTSRPVVEMGWAEQSTLIGMSGTCISPNLYIAFGISGSLQHMEGMRGAAKIISINIDKNAPLHQLCHSIIVADAVDMLDSLLNE